jgi:hypothetical protein
MASILWRLAGILAGSRVAETMVEQLIDMVKPKTAPPPSGGPSPEEARLEMLESSVRDHEDKLAAIGLGLERLAQELRPLVARAAVTFWLALLALALSLISVGWLLLRR